jgi:hypothetical protein
MAVNHVSGRGERRLPSLWLWVLGAVLVILAIVTLFSLLNLEDDGAGEGLGIRQPIGKPAGYVVILDLAAAPPG